MSAIPPMKIITAVSFTPNERLGIGRENTIPWRSKKDMEHFRLATSRTKDPKKRNMVLMGRRTWESLGNVRPLVNRLNVVLSSANPNNNNDEDDLVIWCKSFESALKFADERADEIETIWVIGGSRVYEEAFNHNRLQEVHVTVVHAIFECDTFFPFHENFDLFVLTSTRTIQDAQQIERKEDDENIKPRHHVSLNVFARQEKDRAKQRPTRLRM